LTTTTNHSVLLNDIPNSDFMLERSLWEEGEEYFNSSTFGGPYKKAFVLECHANTPVKWEYKGDGVSLIMI
jgi:hypothetical protein